METSQGELSFFSVALRYYGVIMENQMEKKMENEMETGVIWGLYYYLY